MNTINITGRITADLELKHTQRGVSVCTYTLAVKRPKVKDTTDYIPVVSWRQGAEYLCNYGHKGDMVAVTGTLTASKWQDKDGNNRTSYEVVTDTVEIVSSSQSNQSNTQPRPQNQMPNDFIEITTDDDLPWENTGV